MEANRKIKSGGKGGIFVIIAVLAVVLLQPGGEYWKKPQKMLLTRDVG